MITKKEMLFIGSSLYARAMPLAKDSPSLHEYRTRLNQYGQFCRTTLAAMQVSNPALLADAWFKACGISPGTL